jgi:hypothetical protein
MIAEFNNSTFDAFNNSIFVFLILALLEYVLNDIVSKLILSQCLYVS